MWLMVLFDLPTNTKKQRKAAATFRKRLLNDSFTMMQYSVYIRHCVSRENAKVHELRVKQNVPPDGMVSLMRITDKQFGDTVTYTGYRKKAAPRPAPQLEIF